MANAPLIYSIAQEARRYAAFYPAGSDGRHTFEMFAEFVETRAIGQALKARSAASDVTPCLIEALEAAPIPGRKEPLDGFRARSDAWLAGPYRDAMALAQGIDARRATTAGRGPQDESPVAKPCAPILPPNQEISKMPTDRLVERLRAYVAAIVCAPEAPTDLRVGRAMTANAMAEAADLLSTQETTIAELVAALEKAEQALRQHACHGGEAAPCLRTAYQCEDECGKSAGDALLVVLAALTKVRSAQAP